MISSGTKISATLATVAMALWFSYPYIETAPIIYPITGIDISHHQGVINWAEVKKAGVSFAFMKATEGGDFVDTNFAENWAEAREAGIPVGAYHFYRQCKSGKEQADNFLGILPKGE